MEQQLTHGSLFSGIGGFDLAAEWAGWQNVFHCEWNEFGQKVLKHYWPKAISYADITKTDFSIHRGTIDVLTGGFPCQPYSLAGKRLGKEDDRHLWPEMLRAIREIQPQWVVGENVFGLINWDGGLVFHEVQADLEAEGYEVQPFVLPACAVNAPHRRDRVWFIAFNSQRKPDGGCNTGTSSGTGLDLERNQLVQAGWQQGADNFGAPGFNVANSNHDGLNGAQNGQGHREGNDSNPPRQDATEQPSGCSSKAATFTPNPNGFGLRGQGNGPGKPGIPNQNSTGNYWQDFPTQPSVCTGDDGLPRELDGITFSKWRNESIKAGGNAIVPQVAYQIFQAIKALAAA